MSAKAVFGGMLLIGAGFVGGFVAGTRYDLDLKINSDNMPKVMISKRRIQKDYCTKCVRACESVGGSTTKGDEDFGEGFDGENPFGDSNDGSTGSTPVTDTSQAISGNATGARYAANAAEAAAMDK